MRKTTLGDRIAVATVATFLVVAGGASLHSCAYRPTRPPGASSPPAVDLPSTPADCGRLGFICDTDPNGNFQGSRP